jgi:hypothetical protein
MVTTGIEFRGGTSHMLRPSVERQAKAGRVIPLETICVRLAFLCSRTKTWDILSRSGKRKMLVIGERRLDF